MAEKHSGPNAATLRQQAEEKMGLEQLKAPRALVLEAPLALEAPLSPEEIQRLFHELRVHQIELELQNEELRRAQAALEVSQARYFDLFELAPVGYVTLTEKGLIQQANLTAAGLLGVERNALVKYPLSRFILPEDQDAYYRHRQQLPETSEPQVYELRLKRGDGSQFWAQVNASMVQDVDGAPVCRIVISDISKNKQAEEALRHAQEFNQKILGTTPGMVYIFDLDMQQEVFINHPFASILGYSPEQPTDVGSVFLPIDVHPDDQHILREKLEWAAAGARDGNLRSSEYRVRHASGDWHWIGTREMAFRFADDGTPNQILGVAQDITERKRAEDELRLTKDSLESANREMQQSLEHERVLARSDGLTGLYNYRRFFELATHEFRAALRYRHPLAILMFDADYFKQINDSIGHSGGDQVLVQMAQTVAAQMRSVDVLARYGGDEFVILLPQTNAQQAVPIAERIRESVAAMCMETEKGILTVTLSIGIAEVQHQPPEENIERVIQRADKALYTAKEAGRNRTVVYYAEPQGSK